MKPAEGMQIAHRHFRAMGTEVDAWLWNSHEQRARNALRMVERFFAKTEARLSRFRADSELSRLNRAAGSTFMASPVLFGLVEDALNWRTRTGGIFDPAVLPALIEAGYDRSFADIEAGPAEEVRSRPAAPAHPVNAGDIRLDRSGAIALPAGVALDLGGIAKGWTVQEAVHQLGMWGPCLVDAGGDIACMGRPPAEPWVVTVADPRDETRDLAVLSLENEAVATSSRVKRQWRRDGKAAHHLIDPRTGAPAVTNVLSVTVVAPRLPDAEIHAKTALILGERAGRAYLADLPDVAAILVMDDNRIATSGAFEERAYVPSISTFIDRLHAAG